MSLPYENATSGNKAIQETERLLKRFGCSNFGTMNDWVKGILLVQFTWNGRQISMEASYKGYAAMWLKANPYTHRRQSTKQEWDQRALDKGEMAAPSILRDWIKGQVAAIECGLMPFDHAFMPHMMLPDGRRAIDHMVDLLPALEDHSQ